MKRRLAALLALVLAWALVFGALGEGLEIEPTEEYVDQTVEEIEVTLGEEATPKADAAVDANASEFVIDGGVLKQYIGTDADVIVPAGVTAIANNVFKGMTFIQSVTLPEGLLSIGDNAFHNCAALRSISLPDSLRTIGDNAFWQCYGLQSITLPVSLKELGNSAFNECTGLRWLTIQSTVLRSIGNACFASCANLESVSLPDSVNVIGRSAFAGTKKLTSARLGMGLYSLGEDVFSGSGVKAITIPATLHEIPERAFAECKRLEEVTLQDGIQSIGDYAFSNCDALKLVTIPSSVESIGDGAFYDCDYLSSVLLNEGLLQIGELAFSACEDLKAVSLPESLLALGYKAFADTPDLKQVTFGSSIRAMGDSVFRGSGLVSVVWPRHMTLIPNYTFYGCKSLREITITDRVSVIGESAFAYCSSLVGVELPDSVTAIHTKAFEQCKGLRYIIIPASVTQIGGYAFSGDSALTVYDELGSAAYKYCQTHNIPHKRIGEPLPHDHKPVRVPGYPATYTKTGLTNGTRCSICGEIIRPQEIIPKLQPKKLVLNIKKATVKKGGNVQLEVVTIKPIHKTSKHVKLTWSSSNKKVATVSKKGKVTAKRPGVVYITVEAPNGVKTKCKITVTE